MTTVFIINDGQIEEVDYKALVLKSVETTTSPRGVEPKFHVREAGCFKVRDVFYLTEVEAEDAVMRFLTDTGCNVSIENVTRFEGWTWGHSGGFPKLLRVFETQIEADQWLWLCALQDFENDADAPLYFHQLEEAEDWLFENE